MQRRLIATLLLSACTAFAGAAAPTQAGKDYQQIQTLRAEADRALKQDATSKGQEQAAALLEKALAMLAEPEMHARGTGSTFLYFRGFDVRRDLAAIYAKQGKKEQALALLEGMAQFGQAAPFADMYVNDAGLSALKDEPRFQAILGANRAASRLWESPATPYKPVLTNEEKVAGLSLFWSEARHGFAHFDHVPELDWNRTYMEYLGKVLAAPTTEAYYRVMMEVAPLLRDGHTNIYPPEALYDKLTARPPLMTELVEGKVLVTQVRSPSLAGRIKAGEEIVAIGGQPVKTYAEANVVRHVSASTPQDRDVRAYGYQLLQGDAKKPLQLRLRGADGKERNETVARSGYGDVQPAPPAELRMLPGNIAYLRVDTFDNDSGVKALEAALPQVLQAAGLVIDVRNNGGGNGDNGFNILSYLDNKPFATAPAYVRDDTALERTSGMGLIKWRPVEGSNQFQRPRERVYTGPVAVLIGPRSFSAAEDFAVSYEAMRRGPLIGTPTAGSTGQPLFMDLPGGGRARICVKRDVRPDGRTFVGKGVQPSIVVEPTVADLRAGRDAALERAIEVLGAKAVAQQ
jgi:C-terminal processing protease CtpA/Prc